MHPGDLFYLPWFSGCNRCKHSVCGAGQLRHGHCGVTNVEFGPEFLASLAIAGCRNYAPPMLCDLWAGEGDCHESSTHAGYMATYCGFSCGFCHRGVNGYSCADAPPGYGFTLLTDPSAVAVAPAGEGGGAANQPAAEPVPDLGVDADTGVVTAPGRVCAAHTDHCQRCSADATVCEQCRDRRYLHGGVCGAGCPAGTRTAGRGNFGLRCIDAPDQAEPATATSGAPGCVPRSQDRTSHCNSCDAADRPRCTQCRDSTYLHLGGCIVECPAGFVGTGTGRFNRACAAAVADGGAEGSAACARENGCHVCSTDRGNGGVCTKCRDSTYLHLGACLTQCPEAFRGIGNGRFNRRCGTQEEGPYLSGAAVCAPYSGSCHACSADRSMCVQCRDRAYLHDGRCVPECPPGTDPVGSGRFNRICRPAWLGGSAQCRLAVRSVECRASFSWRARQAPHR